MSVYTAFILGVILGAGAMWLFYSSGLLTDRRHGAADDAADAEQDGDSADGQDRSSPKREVVTVKGLAAVLRHVNSNTDKVTVLRNRLGEIRGPLSGKDVITLLKPVTSHSDRMEVLRLLMPKVSSTIPDKEYERIMSMLSSSYVAEASELLSRSY